jgi:hypothetical protein
MLRKAFSSLFLFLILLNTTGYYGVFIGWKYRHDTRMLGSLDAERYLQQELRTVKIPIAIPYVFDSPGFDRIDGMFEHEGTFYRLVKQKFSSDTLTLVCIRDEGTRKIHDAFSEVAHTFTGQCDSRSSAPTFRSSFIKEYIETSTIHHEYISGWEMNLCYSDRCAVLVPSFAPSIEQPPRL